MSTNTVHLQRVLTAKPEKVYRAFLDPDAMAKWLPPNGFTCRVHHMDAKVGGTYRCLLQTLPLKRAHHLVENTVSWLKMNAYVIQTILMIQT